MHQLGHQLQKKPGQIKANKRRRIGTELSQCPDKIQKLHAGLTCVCLGVTV